MYPFHCRFPVTGGWKAPRKGWRDLPALRLVRQRTFPFLILDAPRHRHFLRKIALCWLGKMSEFTVQETVSWIWRTWAWMPTFPFLIVDCSLLFPPPTLTPTDGSTWWLFRMPFLWPDGEKESWDGKPWLEIGDGSVLESGRAKVSNTFSWQISSFRGNLCSTQIHIWVGSLLVTHVEVEIVIHHEIIKLVLEIEVRRRMCLTFGMVPLFWIWSTPSLRNHLCQGRRSPW